MLRGRERWASIAFAFALVVGACELDRDGALAEPDASAGGVGGAAASGGVSGLGGASGGAGASFGGSAGADAAAGGAGGSVDAGDAAAGSGGVAGSGGSPTWKPPDIAGCALWLDASDPTSITLAGSNVSAWADKCGGTNATAGGAQSPLLGIAGGKPAIRCDGVDDRLTLQGPGQAAPEYSLFFVVGKNFSLADQRPIWSNRNQPAAAGGTVTYLGFYNRTYVYQNTATPPLLQGTNLHATMLFTTIYELVVTPSGKREALLDGQLEASHPSGSSTATTLRVGTLCHDVPNNHFAAYDLHEVIAYSRALTDPERQLVRSELATKWGL